MIEPLIVVQTALGIVLAAGNLVFWWLVVRRWQDRFRRNCERRFRVAIGLTSRGHWNVTGDGSRLRLFAIEWLQLAYFMAAFVVWGIALVLGVLLLGRLQ
jgi:hypothetical protein